jgi:hypothetical protein
MKKTRTCQGPAKTVPIITDPRALRGAQEKNNRLTKKNQGSEILLTSKK